MDKFRLPSLGEIALHTFILSVISGIILLFRYDVSAPYHSVLLIDSVYPYGFFLRNLHFYTSFFAVLFTALHGWKFFFDRYEIKGDFLYWTIGILLFYTVVFVAFSGYVIRFDQEGFFAGRIASQIISSIPVIGSTLSNFFFSGDKPVTFYVMHIVILPFVFFLLLSNHINWKKFMDFDKFVYSNIIPLILSVFVHAPLPPSHEILSDPIKGPWFFVGMQELVYLTPPVLGGIIIPLFYMILWIIYPCSSANKRVFIKYTLIAMTVTYILLSIVALYFRGPGWRFQLSI